MPSGSEDQNRIAAATVLGFPVHPGRAAALGEVHARPAPLVETPHLLIQLAFMTEGGATVDHAVLADLSRANGVAPPDRGARHHTIQRGKGALRWERHTEFSTYLWNGPLSPRTGKPLEEPPFGPSFALPGVVLGGVRFEIRNWTEAAERLVEGFDAASLCYSLVENGQAAAITDFRQDNDGLTRILVLDRGLTPARAGALAQRLIEIETYRMLAMLGLPLAQELSPRIRRIEDRLADVTNRMRARGEAESQTLLTELTDLASELEADAAASLYRFGASRAYDGIVNERLAAIGEQPVTGYETWSAFLKRRMAPAMRTCRSVEERQANLSRKLARATTLLRSWVEVDLQRQNSDLLNSMNRRAQLQLRLQQTVEGLSVAAVSYYIVGLIGYLAKGTGLFGDDLKPDYVTAASVPVVILFVWWMVRRIRHAHGEKD
ncbi:MAG: Egg lysin [Phyllobacteriaceae bacterium]|nr:Egg lysin [Phyllobacteriaceae bacterium]MBA92377.1 Egg lysin [Phyllobacteriaceae bacterium]